MVTQFMDLRKRANNLLGLNSSKKSHISKNNFDELIEELMTHHLELEMQNINLVEAHEEIEESRKKYSVLYDLAPLGYFTLDRKGLITEVNVASADLLGIKKPMLLNRSLARYIAPEYQSIFAEFFHHSFKQTKINSCELKLMKRDGPVFYAKLEGRVIREEVDVESKLLLMVTDITYSKSNEMNIRPQQVSISDTNRSTSTNEATSLAKEINQPLGVISNYVHGCIRRLESGSFETDNILLALKQMSTQLNRATDIIMRMNDLHYKSDSEKQYTCLDIMINEVISLLNYEMNDFPITIKYKKNKNIPKIDMDKLNIQQVILHLARNAIEAMRDARIEEPKLIIQVNQDNVETIEICILDNGPGFSHENTHKLFEPHFTTKPYGMGLGLVVSRTIVESHGGKLFADLNPTYGACFKFTLPITTA